jgi:ElaB/YqjD/DUF883 family membrane-anchored ribosome-binding protein
MRIDTEERKFFERMSKAQEEMTRAQERVADAQERLANAAEKQQPSKAAQALATAGAVGTAIGGLSIVDLVIKWFTGG